MGIGLQDRGYTQAQILGQQVVRTWGFDDGAGAPLPPSSPPSPNGLEQTKDFQSVQSSVIHSLSTNSSPKAVTAHEVAARSQDHECEVVGE